MSDNVEKATAQPEPVYAQAIDVQPVAAAPGVVGEVGVDHNGLQTGQWSTGLFGCFDFCVPNCLMSWCCPCVSMAQVVSRLGYYDYFIAVIVLLLCYCSGFGYVLAWLALFFLRSQFRQTFALPGSVLGDCCATFCCGCCAIAQMATHSKSYKTGACSFAAPETLPGYKEV